ncbi:ParB/RepB/Spo0J family partition protein [Corynebacterium sp. TAE3-ERU12]|uniref:ParB/RepB/Spo0J family partition protein n=1 Tax=Corynebacterium sp. TAE3-ERU12 TaxID=2849491 RepID=UPI001C453560|nr:ParB/RepB/Spo0J family partition protein [Corynebacterium sp. TAE3-ERU12]MBV7294338.1 ParB/RepB/Spo0J family partition protein [Corynebacterium sp. TAE3-ERU12]
MEHKEPRKGGLGRGLAALIPTAAEARPGLGQSAADELFGPSQSRSKGDSGPTHTSGPIRHGDGTKTSTQQPTKNVSRETSAPRGRDSMGATYREIPVPIISPNPEQPRQVFDDEPLNELAHSIREFGLMQPIVVRHIPRAKRPKALELAREKNPDAPQPEYEIIMGERRWRAAQIAGLENLPTIVRETDDSAMLRDALLENIHRVQLNPLEEAAAYQQLLDEFGVTQAQLADRIGRSRPVITNMIRLLALPVPVQRRVAAGVLSAGHARALLGVKGGADIQERLAERIIAEGLSVRATEEAVTLLNRDGEKPAPTKREPAPQPKKLTAWADQLSDEFDTRVTATMGKKKGKLVIEFGDLEDFERIMSLIHEKN